MRNGIKNALLSSGVGLALLIAAAPAMAGGFALREQSAQGMGQAFAGAAAGGGGLSAMFWNPAIITKHPGWTSSWTATGIIPYVKMTPTAGPTRAFGGTGDVALDALTAASASAYQWNDWLWMGVNVSAPYGLATKAPTNWAGQVYARSSKVVTTEVTPTVAIKLNDMVSVGFGLRAMYFKTRLTRALGVAPGAPSAELEGSDWAYGFTAGVTFTPFAGTELGVGYRSQMSPHLIGTLATALGARNIQGKLKLPDQITLGLRQRVTDQLTLLAGYEWTRWSVLSRFPVLLRDGPGAGLTATTLNFDYRDSWYASLGAEYALNPNLTLRAGLGYERSPISAKVRTVRLPDADRIWTTVGATYKWNEKLSFDVSYAHVIPKKGGISYGPGHPDFASTGLPLQTNVKARLDIISAGLTYRWDDPKVVEGTLPLVRKY